MLAAAESCFARRALLFSCFTFHPSLSESLLVLGKLLVHMIDYKLTQRLLARVTPCLRSLRRAYHDCQQPLNRPNSFDGHYSLFPRCSSPRSSSIIYTLHSRPYLACSLLVDDTIRQGHLPSHPQFSCPFTRDQPAVIPAYPTTASTDESDTIYALQIDRFSHEVTQATIILSMCHNTPSSRINQASKTHDDFQSTMTTSLMSGN